MSRDIIDTGENLRFWYPDSDKVVNMPFAWAIRAERALNLLEEYSRHDVTTACNACGWTDRHKADCPIGILFAEIEAEQAALRLRCAR